MKSLKYLAVTFSLMGFFGCDQDPYPTDQEIRDTPRAIPDVILPPIAIEPIESIEFRENLYSEFNIRVAVEEPGEPVVWIDGLPEGASFDPETLTLSWQPGYFDANDANNPTIDERSYPVTIFAQSTAHDGEGEKREINLIVKDSPRPINLNTRSVTPEVDENKVFERIVRFNNADFPDGPFKLITKDLPPSLEVEQIDGITFRLTFKPDSFHVNRSNTRFNYVRHEGKLVAANPANRTREFDYRIQVNDIRQGVKFSAPDEIEQGLDAGFQVAAFDLNREVAPEIELSIDRPQFGHFKTKLEENPNNFSSTLSILWKDIPPRYNNTIQEVNYTACVIGRRGIKDDCEKKTTRIKIFLKDRKPPVIDREKWPVGELLYLGHNKEQTRVINITDAEDSKLTPKVEIFPVEMRKYVTYERSRFGGNQIKMKFDKAGTFQFNVKATSDYNVSSAESFIVEVFSENRNKTLIFADSTRDKEVLFYKERFKTKMDLMNPAIQNVNLRNISGRETVILTTSTLLDPSNKGEILEAIEKIDHVVISSALYRKLPEKFLTRLEEDYGLRAIGRYSELPNLPPLSTMKFVTTDQFQVPNGVVSLKQSTTSESLDPIIFNGGLDEPNKICKGVMGLSENGNNPLRIGVNCKRKNGGKISILGTEWADLSVTRGDEGIVESWFKTLLNSRF